MGKYLKMSDVFDLPVISMTGLTMAGTTPVISLHGNDCNYALHAINSHDELVDEVERLRLMIS